MLLRPLQTIFLLVLPPLLVTSSNNTTAEYCAYFGPPDALSVYCYLDTWEQPIPQDMASLNRSAIVHLRVKITKESSCLTKAHLDGLSNLRRLTVVGSCFDESVRIRPVMVCRDVRGLDSIEAGAFQATPDLISLKLVRHPLVNLSLDGLTALSSLFLGVDHLQELSPIVLDPVRASLEKMTVESGAVDVLKRGLFTNMDLLRDLRWVGTFTKIESGAIAHLPRLESLSLDSLSHLSKVGIRALHNLTNLRVVSFSHIDEPIPGDTFCDLGGANVSTLRLYSISVRFIRGCVDLFQCAECGLRPKNRPQRVQLKKIMNPSASLGLKDLLPLGSLNISELQVIDCQVKYLTDELSRLPLLTRIVIFSLEDFNPERQDSHSSQSQSSLFRDMSSFISTLEDDIFGRTIKIPPLIQPATTEKPPIYGYLQRLTNNPFILQPEPRRLTNATLILMVCDCAVLKLIQWTAKRGDFYLTIGCRNFRCNCSGTANLFELWPWQDLERLETVLTPICSSDVPFDQYTYKETICPVKCNNIRDGGVVSAEGSSASMSKFPV